MSLFSKIFGSNKEGKAPSSDESLNRIRELQETFEKKSEYLEGKIEKEVQTARANMKNKRVALAALKRKKQYEVQLKQIDGTLTNLDMQANALSNARTNAEVFKVMQGASASLKQEHKEFDVDKVHDVMDDMQEQHQIAQEISDAISQPAYGMGVDMDEDDLMKELEELEQEQLDSELLNAPSASISNPIADHGISMPSVPTGQPKKKEEEKEMDDLAAWAS